MTQPKTAEQIMNKAADDYVDNKLAGRPINEDDCHNGFCAGWQAAMEYRDKNPGDDDLVVAFKSHLATMGAINANMGYPFSQPLINAQKALAAYDAKRGK